MTRVQHRPEFKLTFEIRGDFLRFVVRKLQVHTKDLRFDGGPAEVGQAPGANTKKTTGLPAGRSASHLAVSVANIIQQHSVAHVRH